MTDNEFRHRRAGSWLPISWWSLTRIGLVISAANPSTQRLRSRPLAQPGDPHDIRQLRTSERSGIAQVKAPELAG